MLYRFIIGVGRRRSRRAFLPHNHHMQNQKRQLPFFSTITAATTSLTPSTPRIDTDTDFTSKLPTHSITFLTDVEGDGLYFDRFVHHSQILGFRSVTPSFGRWAKIRQQHGDENVDFDLEKCDSSSGDEGKWNYGHYDEEYFPYDKEVVFSDDNSALVYGVRSCC